MDSDDHRPLKKRFVVGHQQAPQQAPQAPQQAPRQQALQQAPRQQARQQAPAQEEPPQEDPPQEVMLDEMIPILIFSACFGVCNSLTRISRWTLKREQRLIIRVCFSVWGESWFEEDANTAEPPPPLPCRYRSLRSLFKTCPLLGCFLKVEQNRSHCCYGHFQLAREFAQRAVAFHYFDGFLDGEHRKRVCILALLNSVRGLQTGVPNLDHVAGLFTTLPWQLKIIPENAGNWLFFKTPPLRYTSMSYTSTNCGTKPPAIWWKKNPFLSIGFEGFDHPPVKYTLFLMDGGDDHHRQLAKDWRLHLFQCQELSLYCLSTGGSLIFAQPEPKLVKKQNPGDGDTSPTDRDPNPVSKIASSKRHRNLPSTSNSSSVPQVPVGNPQGRGRNSMLSFLAVTEGVACRDGETVELQQIKAKKKIGPSFALKNPVSKIASPKHYRDLPSTSKSSSVPQVPVGKW
ncbi:BnaAnng22960D [Brassica napus]|uniref:BnaAnng22960D protein n=1 Tax=Brassica napus TaxID=3708 RepID=A0A078JK44_BRANA|nr:BnaAnng22960D [Brassica napus]